jgi:hypothetical protein
VIRSQLQGSASDFFLIQGQKKKLGDGSELRLEKIDEEPYLVMRRRHAPGIPWALLASIVLVVGMVMIGRRWL